MQTLRFAHQFRRQPRPAAHRTIVVVDVEGFADQRRTNAHQLAIRDGLYRALRRAFGNAGIPWGHCHQEDRGDGVLVLVPPDVPKSAIAEPWPHELIIALDEHNRVRQPETQIRLRVAVHAGEVNYDDHGVTATAINHAFRLLDADPLRAALSASPGLIAMMTSSWFYDEVIRHGPADYAATFRPVQVTAKETTTVGWLCLPDARTTAGSSGPGPAAVAAARTG